MTLRDICVVKLPDQTPKYAFERCLHGRLKNGAPCIWCRCPNRIPGSPQHVLHQHHEYVLTKPFDISTAGAPITVSQCVYCDVVFQGWPLCTLDKCDGYILQTNNVDLASFK